MVTPSTASKYLAALPLVICCARMTTIEATTPLKTLTRTGVPNLALITPSTRGPAPS